MIEQCLPAVSLLQFTATEESAAVVSAETRIREKLTAGLHPVRLDIINESDLHAGHRGSPGTGESHFRVLIVADAFAGLNRVQRHRLVNEILKDDVGTRIHALALATYAPAEKIPAA